MRKRRILNFLFFTSLLFCLPFTLYKLIREIGIFKRNIKIMNRVINNNDQFFDFLDKHGFIPDWVGRLYSPQTIPQEFSDYTEDELYDVVMRAMITSLQHILNQNILLDVCGITVRLKKNKPEKNKDGGEVKLLRDYFIVNITSNNEPIIKSYFKWFIASLMIYIIFGIILIISIS